MEDRDNIDPKQLICPYANRSRCDQTVEDEINLLDMMRILWKYRFLVLGITVLITVMASAYAFLSPKLYEVKVTINPSHDLGVSAQLAKIEAFNPTLPEESLAKIKSPEEKALVIVIKNLQDRNVQELFLTDSETVKLIKSEEKNNSVNILRDTFVRNLSIKLPKKKSKNQNTIVSLSGENPDLIAELLNGFILYVGEYSKGAVVEGMKLSEQEIIVEQKLEILRREAEKNIKRHLAKLVEQKKIAEKLNIIEIPRNFSGGPPYIRGVKALQTEIDIIKQRKNNELFIEDDTFLALQEQLKAIKQIDFSTVEIAIMQAETAIPPRHHKKPKRLLIVILGLIVGGMSGVISAILFNFIQKHKDQLTYK